MALTGLRIETNISNVTKEFDDLIRHINDTLAKPFNINFDINKIQEQIQEVTNSVAKMQEQIDKTASNKSMLDSTQTQEEGSKIGKTIEQIKEQLSSLGEVQIKYTGYNEMTGEFDRIIAKVKEADGIVRQFNAERSSYIGETPYYTLNQSSMTDSTQATANRQAIQQQNQQLQESLSLLKQEYNLESDINSAKQKGRQETLLELQAQQQLVQSKLAESATRLNNDNRAKLTQQAIQYQNDLNKQITQEADKITQVNAKLEQQVTQFKKLAGIKLQNLESSILSASNKGVDISSIKDQVSSLRELSGTMNASNFSEKQRQWNNELKQTQANLRTANAEARNTNGILGDIVRNIGKFAQWSVSATALMTFVNGIKDAVDYANQLNVSLSNIQMVTGASTEQASAMVEQYRQLAGLMGQNDVDFLQGAEQYLRAGYSDSDIETMLKNTAMASAISGESNADMSDSLVAMKNAYELTSDEVGTLVDRISTLDSESSASFSSIAEGMKRSAANAKEVGVEYQTLASYIATVQDVTHRSATTIGENFKSIFSRMTSVKAGLTDTNGMGINDVEKVLDRQNIKIRENSGEWRNMSEVISEIGNRWSEFDGVTKSQIANAIAGKEQANTFLTLMQNITKQRQLEADAINAQGSAEAKYQIYQDSTKAKINQLTVSLHTMYSEMVNSNQINTAVSGLQSILNVANGLIKQFGILPLAMTAIIPILSQVNDKFTMLKFAIDKDSGKIEWTGLLANGINKLKSSLSGYSEAYAKYIQQLTIARGEQAMQPSMLTKISASMLAVGNSAVGATIKTVALTAALSALSIVANMAIGFGIGLAITGLIGLFTSLANKVKDAQTEIQNLSARTNELKQNEQLVNQYENLSTQLQNTSKDSAEYKNIQKQVLDMQKQLAENFPSLIDGYDAEGNALVKNIDKLRDYNSQKKLMIQADATDAYSTMYNQITKKSGLGIGNIIAGGQSLTGAMGFGTSEIEDYNKYIKLLDEEMKTTGKDTKGYADKVKEASSHIQSFNENSVKLYNIGQTNVDYFDVATGKLVKYSDYLKQGSDDTKGNAGNIKNLINQYNQLSNSGDNSADTQQKLASITSQLKDRYGDLEVGVDSSGNAIIKNTDVLNEHARTLGIDGDAANSAKNNIKSLETVVSELSDAMSKAKGNISSIDQVLQQHAETGEWNYDVLLSLIKTHPELLGALGDEKALTEALTKAKQDEVNTAESSINEQINLRKNEVVEGLKAYGLDISNFSDAQSAKTALAEKASKDRIDIIKNEALAFNNVMNAIQDNKNSVNSMTGLNSDLGAVFNKDTKDYQEQKNKEFNDKIKSIQTGVGNTSKSIDEYFNLQKLLDNANTMLNNIGNENYDGKKNSTTKSKADTEASKALTAESRNIANRERELDIESKGLEAQRKALELQKKHAQDSLEEGYKAEQAQQNAIIDKYKSQLDMLQKKKDLQDETNSAIDYENKIKKDQLALDNAQNEKTVLITENGQAMWVADQTRIDAAREQLAKDQEDYRRWKENQAIEKQKTDIQDKIDATSKAKDIAQENYNTQKDAIEKTYEAKFNAIDAQKDAISNQKDDLSYQKNSINDRRNTLQGYASGTDDAEQGIKEVSEDGIEIVIGRQLRDFKGGEVVLNNRNTEKLLQNNPSSNNNNTNSGNDGQTQSKSARNTLNAVGTTIENNKNIVKKPVNDLINDVDNDIQHFVNESSQYGKGADKNVGDAVTNNKLLVKKPVDDLITEIVNMIQKFVDNAGQYGQNTDKNIGTGITNTQESVLTPTRTLISNVKGLITPFVSSMQGEGKNIDINIGKGLSDGNNDLMKNIEDLCKQMVDKFNEKLDINSPSKVMYKIGQYMIEGLIKGMDESDIEKFITDKVGGMTGAVNSQVANVPGSVTDWIKQAIQATGVSESWLPALQTIAMHESSGNPNDVNNWDSNAAAGTPSKGLMQTIEPTFRDNMMSGHNNIFNPIDNTIAAINYIKKRYGNVNNVPGIKSLARGSNYVGYQTGTNNATPGMHELSEDGRPEIVIGKQARLFNGGETVLNGDKTMNILQSLMPKFEMSDFSNLIPRQSQSVDNSKKYSIQHVEIVQPNDFNDFVTQFEQYVTTHT